MVSIGDKKLIEKWDKNHLLSNNGTNVCQRKRVTVH